MFKEYADYDATGLAALINSGQVSAAEVLDAALAAIDAGEPKINAIATDIRDKAKAQLQTPLSGPFAGVPFLLKDIDLAYAGVRQTAGAVALKNYTPTETSEIVKRYLAAGLVITATTTTPELALKATTETELHGATRNPWNLNHTPGGSSGGSGAAVAARYVPMAAAADGGGSIRIPAAYCGLFGLKPSRGRVSSAPNVGEKWDGCDVTLGFSHSVRDSAALLDAIAGPAPGDPFIIAPPERPYIQEIGAPVARLRIGFSTKSPIGGRVDPEMVTAVHNTAKLLESLGHIVEEATPAINGTDVSRGYMGMYFGHVSAALAKACKLTGAKESSFHPDTRAIALLGRALSAEAFVTMRADWNIFARAMGKFHETYDIYVTPTTAMGPAKIGELETPKSQQTLAKLMVTLNAGKLLLKSGIVDKLAFENLERTPFTQLANMIFCPAMSVPLHWGADGLPVGVHFAAKFGQEGLLLRLASQLETAQPWAHRRPTF
ncbi:MAG: amidase [Acidocella sp. 20-57-95]|nr:MAG: amidase [Acidocella sp. 20-57-95]OYV62214.1 MAG: amidase [Acidocella sp. 21-58-7]HQT63748.1 amidase [Acidocella sp.]HQU03124.1 amidase [Acidocella sp.]